VFLETIEIGNLPISGARRTGDPHHTGTPSGGAVGQYTRPVHKSGQKLSLEDKIMQTWTKPAVREQEIGLEVTSYLPAEIDVI
jgi:coenzyme PQQ precursor peptide PqqA